MADLRRKNTLFSQPKTTQLPIFIVAKTLPTDGDGEIYGLEIMRAMEDVIGKKASVECIQKVNGLWRLIVFEKRHRDLLLQTGLNIRGYTITLHSRNPFLNKNGEEQVRLIISNVPYSIANEEIIKSLDSIGVTVSAKDIQWENYRNENRDMLSTKTGRRFIFIDPPTSPLPTSMRVAGKSTAYLNYKGMQKKTKQLGFRARHGSESQSDESDTDTETGSGNNNGQAAALPNKTVVTPSHSATRPDDVVPLTGRKGELVAGSPNITDTEHQSLPKVSQPAHLNDIWGTFTSSSGSFKIPPQPALVKEFPLFVSSRSRSSERKNASDSDRSRSRSDSLKRPGSDKVIKSKQPKKAKRKLSSASGKTVVPYQTLAAATAFDQEEGILLNYDDKKTHLNCCLKYDWYEMMWVYT